MNITQESFDSEVIQIQHKLDKIYEKYSKTEEDDKEERRRLRQQWKTLTEKHYNLTKSSVYRKSL